MCTGLYFFIVSAFGEIVKSEVAGDNLSDALKEIEALNDKGIMATLDHLGEVIKHLHEAAGYRDEYIRLVEGIAQARADSNISLKPTQMGLALDAEKCRIIRIGSRRNRLTFGWF